MKQLKLLLMGLFALAAPVLFYTQAVKLSDKTEELNKQAKLIEDTLHRKTIDSLKIALFYEKEKLRYHDSLLGATRNTHTVYRTLPTPRRDIDTARDRLFASLGNLATQAGETLSALPVGQTGNMGGGGQLNAGNQSPAFPDSSTANMVPVTYNELVSYFNDHIRNMLYSYCAKDTIQKSLNRTASRQLMAEFTSIANYARRGTQILSLLDQYGIKGNNYSRNLPQIAISPGGQRELRIAAATNDAFMYYRVPLQDLIIEKVYFNGVTENMILPNNRAAYANKLNADFYDRFILATSTNTNSKNFCSQLDANTTIFLP